jgi:hypothetical protein
MKEIRFVFKGLTTAYTLHSIKFEALILFSVCDQQQALGSNAINSGVT